jgi:hypothetical protein
MDEFKINNKQLFLGFLFLLAGTMVYLVDRPIGSTYVLHNFTSVHTFFHRLPNLYGKLGLFAPEFFHPLALSLISMSLVSNRKSKKMVCCVWLVIDSIFELGQIIGVESIELLPKWFMSFPVSKDFMDFFVYGTFDIYDLVAVGLGSFTAYIVLELDAKKGGSNEQKYSGEESFKQKISELS